MNNEEVLVRYSNGLEFDVKGQKLALPEDEFFQLWDEIRKNGVFPAEVSTKKVITYGALQKLGYLSKVWIQDNKTGKMRNGYQLNEGLGRAYGLKDVLA